MTELEFPQRPMNLNMPSHQRIKLLYEWAKGTRKADCDVVARVALDEIEELKIHITALNNEIRELKGAKR